MSEPIYPIGAVSKLTGLSPDSIRSWERRYGAIQPTRVKGGRLYSEQDVYRLKLLKRAVDSGHAISRIALLANDALEMLPIARPALDEDLGELGEKLARVELEKAFAAILDYDALAADRILGKLAMLMSARDFTFDVVAPMMQMVGQAWEQGRMNIAQEHLSCSLLRNILGAMMRLHGREDAPAVALFTTLPGELHEFGILAAAMLAAAGGLGVLYLGPNLPVAEIAKAARKAKVRAVALGFARTGQDEGASLAGLEALRRALPDGVALVAGGRLSPGLRAAAGKGGFVCLDDLTQFETYLKNIGARY